MKQPGAFNHQRGVAAVELALVIVFLLLLVAGIVEFGRAFWYYDALTKATRDGARMLSVADRGTFSTGTFIDDAKNRVVQAANSANIKPALTTAQVSVTCLNDTFSSVGCASGVGAPANVQVAISGYTITIGGMIPFLSPTGGASKVYSGVALAPQTTMRYMN
ncbi:TadE/TadG family type IV pilus assembly protein [Azoarcus sp. KH32C]|uniref:TadE/TadG family type IV pilus assembly protein n=1 Tax=Azoarcus sp. KH32C TaxID=748247 RepID=UPI00023867B4|nr:TadE/TadG family type IV pilus assembly protein [Azoarcus sp. KH32C]BAL26418.1 hypothetical protein AZKH_4138 [Azoarcus sp. KH32C]